MNFSELMDALQRGTLPQWLVDQVANNRQRLITRLQLNGCTTIYSPDQSIVIKIERLRP